MTAAAEKLHAESAVGRSRSASPCCWLAAGLLAVLGLFVPITPLLRGWLVAFAICGSIPIGSMTWLLIHRLTGGEWGIAAAPVLRPAAAMSPLSDRRLCTRPSRATSHLSLGRRSRHDTGGCRPLVSQWTVLSAAQPDRAGRVVLSRDRVRRRIRRPPAGRPGTGVLRPDHQPRRSRLVPVAGAALCRDRLCSHDRDPAAADGARGHRPDRAAHRRGQGGGRSWRAADRDAAWRGLSRIHDLRGRLVWRPARKVGLVSEACQFGLDIGFDDGACGGRGAAVRDAADAAGPSKPPRIAHRFRR